jgi:hypothetical protein
VSPRRRVIAKKRGDWFDGPRLTWSQRSLHHQKRHMFWIRAHLTVATAIIASTHVTAIAATSLALCCAPHHHATEAPENTDETGTSAAATCPLHRAAEETCSMPQCPMHSRSTEVSDHLGHVTATAHQHHAERTTVADDDGAFHGRTVGTVKSEGTKALPNTQQCQLVCDEDELSPLVVLGHPGVLPRASAVPTPDRLSMRLPARALSLPTPPRPVFVPPPRS